VIGDMDAKDRTMYCRNDIVSYRKCEMTMAAMYVSCWMSKEEG
jgi:hypothetical protein